jgi:hypothetical protein
MTQRYPWVPDDIINLPLFSAFADLKKFRSAQVSDLTTVCYLKSQSCLFFHRREKKKNEEFSAQMEER